MFDTKDKIELGAGCLVVVLLMIFAGTLGFGCGWLGGLFLKWFVGESVADGLNMVLGNITQYNFTPDDIPLFSAILTTIGSFFKPTISSK